MASSLSDAEPVAIRHSVNSFDDLPDELAGVVYGVFGIPISPIDMPTALHRIKEATLARTPFLISTPNLNFLINSRSDPEFRESLLLSDLCTADGMPIVWMSRLVGIPIKERIAGSDIFDALKSDNTHPLKVFLFGGIEGAAEAAGEKINSESRVMRCVGSYYPGFGTVEAMSEDSVINLINRSDADLLVVALGAKKGQKWLLRNHDRLEIPVRVHLGAAINFQAGVVKRAPVFMQKWGLEWLWRIKEEPHLWNRYWADGIALVGLAFTQIGPLFLLTHWDRLRWRRKQQDLLIARSEDDQSITLSLNGAATDRHVNKAAASFHKTLAEEKPIAINFAGTCLIDARFMGLLLMLNKQLKRRGLSLTFTATPPHIERTFRLNGFEFLLRPQG